MSADFKALGSYAGPEMQDNSLYMYIDFSNPKSYSGSGTTIYDLSGNGRNGTLVNSPTFTNSAGGSATFGSTKYIDFSTSGHSLANTNFTVEVVARTSTNPNSYQDLFTIQANSNTAADSIGFYKARSGVLSGSYYGGLWTSGGTNNYASTTYTGSDIAAAGWIHLVLTVELSGTYVPKIYWNGTLNSTGSSNISSFNFSTINYFRVADGGYYSGENFLGDIAYVKFYTRALTAAEVTQSYSAFRQRFSTPAEVKAGLILDLDAGNTSSYSGSGSTWTDLSGSGYNATISGSPTFTSSGSSSYFTINNGVTNQYMQASVPKPNLPVTLSFWAYPLNATASYVALFDTAPNTQNVLRLYGGSVEWWNADPAVAVTPSISSNNWYNFVFVYDYTGNRKVSFYLNGRFIQTGTGSTTSTYAWSTFVIGNVNGNAGGVFSGRVAKAAIYNRALSALEIGTNFDALRGRYGL